MVRAQAVLCSEGKETVCPTQTSGRLHEEMHIKWLAERPNTQFMQQPTPKMPQASHGLNQFQQCIMALIVIIINAMIHDFE